MELFKHFTVECERTYHIGIKICGLKQYIEIFEGSVCYIIEHYLDNLKHGLSYVFLNNGDDNRFLKRVITYKHGKRNGIELNWKSSGDLYAKESYLDDKKHGTYYFWHFHSNTLHCVSNYSHELLNGKQIMYYENGNLREKTYYKNGVLRSVINYKLDGSLAQKTKYY